MTKPAREAPTGSAYLGLRALARRTGRPTAEAIQLYVLERFVARVGASPHAHRLVLKGGVLMAAFGARRPTRDVDLLAVDTSNDVDAVRALVLEVATLDLNDGVQIDLKDNEARIIREGGTYPGVRVRLRARLATARVAFHVDVNVGDPVEPPARPTEMPTLLNHAPFVALAYPVEMVIAEKLVTAMQRGGTNTRWRDFVDLLALAQVGVDDERAARSLRRVAEHRGVGLTGFGRLPDEFSADAEIRWQAWTRKSGLKGEVPDELAEVLATLAPWVDRVVRHAETLGHSDQGEGGVHR